jgi:hypothetical protein
MKARLLGMFCILALGAACGDDDGENGGGDGGPADGPPTGGDSSQTRNCAMNGGEDCFDPPTAALMAVADDVEQAPNFACAPEAIMNAATPITVSGTVFDFQIGTNEIPMATVTAYYGDITGAAAEEVTADSNGDYTIVLPAGAPNRMAWKTTRPSGGLATYALNEENDIGMAVQTGVDRENVSVATANALPAFIGHARTEGLGVVAGTIQDCDGNDVKNAIGTIASAASDGNAENIEFVAGAEVYYFDADSGLPVRRTSQASTNTDGLFVVIEIPPTSGSAQNYLQVWGYLSAADVAMGVAGLSLLAELPTAVLGDSVISLTMNPNKGPL